MGNRGGVMGTEELHRYTDTHKKSLQYRPIHAKEIRDTHPYTLPQNCDTRDTQTIKSATHTHSISDNDSTKRSSPTTTLHNPSDRSRMCLPSSDGKGLAMAQRERPGQHLYSCPRTRPLLSDTGGGGGSGPPGILADPPTHSQTHPPTCRIPRGWLEIFPSATSMGN